MHIKAIQIKEQLLGHEDYEVALSVGHLASLYNYDMNQYEDAERLYLRSIAIGQYIQLCLGPLNSLVCSEGRVLISSTCKIATSLWISGEIGLLQHKKFE